MVQVLEKLRAAGVATHAVSTSLKDTLSEREFLDALLAATSGNLFRLAPFAYAFDVGNQPPSAQSTPGASPAAPDTDGPAGLIRSVLERRFGTGAVDLAEISPSTETADGAIDAESILLVEALATATETAIRRESITCRAVIDAEFAMAVARVAANGVDGLITEHHRTSPIAHRLNAIEDRLSVLAENAEQMAAQKAMVPGLDRILDRLSRMESGLLALQEREPADQIPPQAPEIDLSAIGALSERLDDLSAQMVDIAEQLASHRADAALASDQVSGAVEPVVARLERQLGDLQSVTAQLAEAAASADIVGDWPPAED